MARRVSTVLLTLLLSAVAHTQEPPSIRGFVGSSTGTERDVERRFHAVPSPENLREYMRTIAGEPHHAGSPGSRKVADYVLAKFKSWGLNAQLEEFEALMPYPTGRVLELVGPDRFTAQLKEPAFEEDPDSADAGQLPSFNAYSADGDVTAELVYVNYGTPEDYEQLAKLGVGAWKPEARTLRVEDAAQDPRPADFVRRRAAAAANPEGSGWSRRMAWRAASDVSRRPRAIEGAHEAVV